MPKPPIIIFHLDDGRELRGGQRQALRLAVELQALGLKNIVVCRKNSPLSREAAAKGVEVFTLPYLFEWDPVSAFLLRKKINQETAGKPEIAVLHSHTSHTAALSLLCSFGRNCARVVHRRVDFIPPAGLSTKLKYSAPARVIAISKAVRAILINAGVAPERIFLIYSSLDLNCTPWSETGLQAYRASARETLSARFGLEKDAFWTGSLAALVPHKDPFNFIRSARIVLDAKPGTHFLLAGDGKLLAGARSLVNDMGLAGNFHFLGHYGAPYELLSALDLFVLSSREEGMGSVLLEAMNARVPITATDAGGITEVIENGKNGLIAPRENPGALAAVQLRVMDDAKLGKALADEGAARLTYFSAAKMAAETVKVYEDAIADIKPH